MINKEKKDVDLFNNATELIKNILKPWVAKNLILEELSGIYGNKVVAEMGEIIKYYNIYENGAEFLTAAQDYIPSELRFKKIKTLINKEARFMFANPIDIKIKSVSRELSTDKEEKEISIIQNYVNEVMKKNHFNANLIKGCKDCLIGKRIAIICNFSPEYGITISFVPSLSFVYENDEFGNLIKIVVFYSLNDAQSLNDQRIQKKKYWLENGYCHVNEAIYDGAGNLVETLIENEITYFDYIPAVIILNDGLTGDTLGESEIVSLFDYEQSYSKLANKDIDAENMSMNPIRYTKDISPESTSNLSIAAGAFWDLASDTTASDNLSGDVGVLETNLNYSEPLANTLKRIEETMYEQVAVPMVNTTDLKGIVSSGKTLKAIYWGLTVRCDEKMLAWKYELELLVKCLIDGAKLYPEIAQGYFPSDTLYLSDVDYTIDINNNYSLPEDEEEEKTVDLAEVSHKVRSIKSYMKKWHNLTDEEADAEIKQIALEKQMIEESYFNVENPMNELNEFEENEDENNK